jgi:hypothetical protein
MIQTCPPDSRVGNFNPNAVVLGSGPNDRCLVMRCLLSSEWLQHCKTGFVIKVKCSTLTLALYGPFPLSMEWYSMKVILILVSETCVWTGDLLGSSGRGRVRSWVQIHYCPPKKNLRFHRIAKIHQIEQLKCVNFVYLIYISINLKGIIQIKW